jgi:hypothetical protein
MAPYRILAAVPDLCGLPVAFCFPRVYHRTTWRPMNRTAMAQRLPAHDLFSLFKGEAVLSPLLLRIHIFSVRSELFALCAPAAVVRCQSSVLRRTSAATPLSSNAQRLPAEPSLSLLRASFIILRSSLPQFIFTACYFAVSPATIVLPIFRRPRLATGPLCSLLSCFLVLWPIGDLLFLFLLLVDLRAGLDLGKPVCG